MSKCQVEHFQIPYSVFDSTDHDVTDVLNAINFEP